MYKYNHISITIQGQLHQTDLHLWDKQTEAKTYCIQSDECNAPNLSRADAKPNHS